MTTTDQTEQFDAAYAAWLEHMLDRLIAAAGASGMTGDDAVARIADQFSTELADRLQERLHALDTRPAYHGLESVDGTAARCTCGLMFYGPATDTVDTLLAHLADPTAPTIIAPAAVTVLPPAPVEP